jgi:hypothetical protein
MSIQVAGVYLFPDVDRSTFDWPSRLSYLTLPPANELPDGEGESQMRLRGESGSTRYRHFSEEALVAVMSRNDTTRLTLSMNESGTPPKASP